MSRSTYAIAILFILFGSLVFAQADGDESDDSLGIEWVNNITDAQEQALTENKVILLDFWSPT